MKALLALLLAGTALAGVSSQRDDAALASTMLLNPFWFALGGGGGEDPDGIDYAYAENLVQVTESAGTPTDLVSLTLTPDSAVYAILWQADGWNAGTLATTGGLVDNGSTVTSFSAKSRASAPADKHSFSGLNFITGDGSTERTLKIQGNGPATNSSFFNQSRITALKLGADDEYAHDATVQTISSDTFQTLLQVQFTPPSAGDYYVIYHLKAGLSGSSFVEPEFEFSDGTTTTGGAGYGAQCDTALATDYKSFFVITKLTNVSTLQTATIKGRSNVNGTNVKFKDAAILVLRADRFADSYFVRDATQDFAAAASYTTTIDQTFTPVAADHLTLMAAWAFSNSSSVSSYAQSLDGAEQLNETVLESFFLSGMFGHQVEAYPASSRTQAIQRKTEGANNGGVQDGAAILCLSLEGLNSG